MSTSKRIISLLLALVMVLGMLPWNALGVEAAGLMETVRLSIESAKASGANPSAMAENNSDPTETTELGDGVEVTRAQWVQELVKLFSMTVEEDNYPDNYFSDLTGDEEYYRDILVAVEFGVIDIEAGLPFNPDDAATREFAAHTLNYCLGFQLDEDAQHSFIECEFVKYPDDIQIAINRTWFSLENGSFMPDIAITDAEKAAMLKDAQTVIESDIIDSEYESTFEFDDQVIVIPEESVIPVTHESEVILLDSEIEIDNGDIFAAYIDGVPFVFSADAVKTMGAVCNITVTQLNINDYLIGVDAQGSMDTNLADFEVAEGLEAIYVLEDGTRVNSIDARGTQKIQSIYFYDTIGGFNIVVELYDMQLNWKSKGKSLSTMEASAVVTGKTFCSVTVPYGFTTEDVVDTLVLGKLPIGYFGSISVSVDISVDGSVSVSYGGSFSAGISYSASEGFRMPKSFQKTHFSLSVEANLEVAMTLQAGLDNIPMISAGVYATMGIHVGMTVRYRGEESTPKMCVHTDSWLFARAGVQATVGIKGITTLQKKWSNDLVYWDRNSSPVRSISHFEDGVLVGKCSCGDTNFGGYDSHYYSPSGSRYGNGGISAVYKPPTYTYSVDENGNATITGYSGNVDSLSIPSTIDGYPVTAIGNNAFYGNTSLYTVAIPAGVVAIGSSAFSSCLGLRNVILPNTLNEIGGYAFSNCKNILQIDIPDSVTDISGWAFADCTNLQSVKLSKGLVNIGRAAFNGCSKLTEITIPKSLEYCDGRQNYPEDGVFHGTNLTTVHWEDGVTRVVEYLFQGCESLKQVTIPNTVTEIKYLAFADSGLAQVEIPNSVTNIGWGAFENCANLTTVDIPDSVTEIGGWIFADCTNLQSVKLSKGLVNIGRAAFNGCSKLTEITIPKSLEYCDGHQNYPEDGVFHGTNLTTVHWEDGVTRVVEYLFQGCESLKQVTIPNTVTEIRYEAFADSGLTQIVIPNSVTTIWWGAFENCFGLNAITFSEKLEKIDSGAFENCTGLTSVEIPDSVVTIESFAFKNCKNLDSITLSKSLIELERETFRDCDALVEIIIPENVRCIRSACFYDCDALKSIAIPFGITFIEDSAFYDCDALETVDMANSVTSLGSSAFKHCDVLKNVKLSRNLTAIPSEAFRECAELAEIVIPYFTTKIEANAFNSSPKLTKVVTHEKLETINTSAFSYADRTVFYGPTGSYTNTWCTDNGYSFVENTAATTKVTAAESSVTIPKGKTYMLDFDIDPIDFHEIITTKSSNTAVATVDETGKITAVAPGTAIIKIIVGGASASCKVTVTQGVTKITLDKTRLSLDVPETYQLTATITPADASNKTLNWTSSNPAAATVDENGLVTAVGNGTAVIKAEAADGTGISASCTVTVIDPSKIPVSSITLDKTALSLEAMETYQLTASVSPTNAANKALIWTSSNEAVATVDSKGQVTAVAKGTATITATAADGYGASASCTVTVTNNGYVVTALDQFQSSHPYANSCTDFWLYTQPGAGSVNITFDAETEMEDGFDYLYIYDGEGNLIGKYTGTELANQTITIPGDTVKVQIESDDSSNAWGFRVTDIGFTDHTHSFTNYVSDGNATCTEDGTKTAKCDHCDATDTIPDAGSALGHDMGSWETSVLATCTENGEEQRTCSRCDHVESRAIEAVGHSWDKGVVTREPTEDTEGERLYTCTACGATRTESIPVIGHEHRYEAVVTAPTCTERGYTTYTCKCGESYVADYVDALGHSFGDWTVIQEPTTTEEGLEERSCNRCGHIEQRSIAKLENPFSDVAPGSFYYEPVMWAVENGITNGTSATTFGPNDQCMRAHVVTFLWRAVGSPEPTRTDNPFVDVKPGDFYYKPVLWALENGMTSGMDAIHFGPTSYCNRAQVVTFLYRTMGSPALEIMDNPFTDVQAGAFYEKPVLWAVQNGITNGLSATSFGPNSICNRAQIVTFLYRAFVD